MPNEIEKNVENDEEIVIPETVDEAWEKDVKDELELDESKKEEKSDVGQEAEKENKVDWKALGLDVFAGKTEKEVADQIKFERKQLGHTTNMLGELRKKVTQLESKPQEKKDPAEKPKDVLAEIEDLDESDMDDFNDLYDKSPIKAFMAYGGDTLRKFIAEEVKKSVPDVSNVLRETKEQIEKDSFLSSNTDITETDDEQVRIFDDEQYLGGQGRSYIDLYGLAKLWREKDERAEKIYLLMKKHPTVNFSEACELTPEADGTNKVDKEKIRNTVNKNKKINRSSHPKQQAVSIKTGATVDEVWEEFDD